MRVHSKKYILPRRSIELSLQKIPPFSDPKPKLEQYTVPAGVAATVLHIAAYSFNDIIHRRVYDLGCGTGRLAIGAALLDADIVVGVDIDPEALRTARYSSKLLKTNRKNEWIQSDIEGIEIPLDTVIMNPPYGVQVKHSDRRFLKCALKLSRVIYSLHKAGESNRQFLTRFIKKAGGVVHQIIPLQMVIPHQFSFHRKKRYQFRVELYRILQTSEEK
jgi:putative methylase